MPKADPVEKAEGHGGSRERWTFWRVIEGAACRFPSGFTPESCLPPPGVLVAAMRSSVHPV